MIIRIVKMTFKEEETDNFLQLFNERKELIRNFDGCNHLELWQQKGAEHIYFTYSMWESEEHLNHYRFSELFKDTWAKTKCLFSEKAQAWSVEQKMLVNGK